MVARHIHRHVQRLAVAAQHGEERLHALLTHVDRTHIGIFIKTVGHGRTGYLWQDLAHDRVIHAHHRQTVERQVVKELDEGFLQLVEVTAIGAHVIHVDVGDHRDHRLQVQEAGVTLIGFGDQVTAAAQLRVGAGCIQAATNHKRRVQATSSEHRGQQTGGSGLAMGAGNGNTMAIAHQLGEHLGARHYWNTTFQGRGHFRVAGVYRAGDNQHVSLLGVFGAVANKYLRAEGFQALGHSRGFQIGAGHFITQVEQHFGDTAHAGTTDADEVDTANAAHAADFRTCSGGRLSHGPPPGRYRQRCRLHRAWPDDEPSAPFE